MALMTRHDTYEPASKHTVYQRCLCTRAILCGIITKWSEFKIIIPLADMAEIFSTSISKTFRDLNRLFLTEVQLSLTRKPNKSETRQKKRNEIPRARGKTCVTREKRGKISLSKPRTFCLLFDWLN